MWRSLDHILGEDDCTKPETSDVIMCNPSMHNQGFVDVHSYERRTSCDKEHHEFECGEKADARHTMGLHEW